MWGSKLKFYASVDPRNFGYCLYGMSQPKEGNRICIINPVEMVSMEKENGAEKPPMMSGMSKEDLAELMDALWRIGIRPSIGEGHIGELNATKEHLKDMKAIAFHKLGVRHD